MKITKVDVIQIKTPSPSWRPILCYVYMDEGIYGDGGAALVYGITTPAVFDVVHDPVALIVGMDPLDSKVVWDALYKNTFWGQNDDPVVFAGISAIDFTLRDIRSKFFNAPVHKLLGGKKQDNLYCYASQLQFGWSDCWEEAEDAEEYVANARKAVEEGYDAIKTDFFTFDRKNDRRSDKITGITGISKQYYVGLVEEYVTAVCEAVGPDTDIIMKDRSVSNTNGAIQLARVMKGCNIFYFEEPNTPSSKTAKLVAGHVDIPTPHGERVYSRRQYAQCFESTSMQVIQPDLGNCGGTIGGKKICDMAHIYDISVQARVCAGPLSTATALQLECVIPNSITHEHHRNALFPHNRELCIYDHQPVNGTHKVPEPPGLGNEFSERALAYCDKITAE